MLHRTSSRLAAALLLGGAAIAIGAAAPDAQATQTRATVSFGACTAKVSDSVAVAPTPVTVQASLTQAIGDSVSASLPPQSNVDVEKVAAAASGNALQLTLNTSKATPGEYTLSMKGTAGECTGQLKVIK